MRRLPGAVSEKSAVSLRAGLRWLSFAPPLDAGRLHSAAGLRSPEVIDPPAVQQLLAGAWDAVTVQGVGVLVAGDDEQLAAGKAFYSGVEICER